MDDGLTFPYRLGTDRADARVLTCPRGGLLAACGRGGAWGRGPSVLVGKRVNRGDAQW